MDYASLDPRIQPQPSLRWRMRVKLTPMRGGGRTPFIRIQNSQGRALLGSAGGDFLEPLGCELAVGEGDAVFDFGAVEVGGRAGLQVVNG